MDVRITPCLECKDSFFSNRVMMAEIVHTIILRGEEAGGALLAERLAELHATHT